jgi:hypothetical protein
MNTALQFLLEKTNTKKSNWEQFDGIPSGVGVEFWYRNKKTQEEAYICIDQGEIVSFSIN